MTQTDDGFSTADAVVEVSTDGITYTDISGSAASVKSAELVRTWGGKYTHSGDTPILANAKRKPTEAEFIIIYTEGVTDPFEVVRAVYEAKDPLWVRWRPKGSIGANVFLINEGMVSGLIYPETEADRSDPAIFSFKITSKAINTAWWLMPLIVDTQFAGIVSTSFADNGELNGGGYPGDGLTIISGVIPERVLQDGYVRQLKAYVRATGALSKGFRFKVFRPNGVNYDFVGESEKIIPIAAGTQTYNLIIPIPCRPGDILGIWIEADDVPKVSITATTKGATADSIRYAVGDIVTTNAFASTIANLSISIEGLGVSPALVVTGDSIACGHSYWETFYDNGPAGTLASEPWYLLRQKYDPLLEYQNHAKDSQTFAWVASTGIVSAIASGPARILIHCGVNDVAAGRSWSAVDTDLDTIRGLVPTTIALYIDEILPWTAGTDGNAATIRTWNANLAVWCAANNATLVLCHDAMGKVRAGTGQLDDLVTAYDLDGVHLTTAGNAALATIIRTYL